MVRLKFTFPLARGKVAEDYFPVPGKSEFAKQISTFTEESIHLGRASKWLLAPSRWHLQMPSRWHLLRAASMKDTPPQASEQHP